MQISLKAARVNAGLLQSEVAKTLGVNESTLRNWEKGKTFPTANMMARLCKLYGASIEEIFLTKQ